MKTKIFLFLGIVFAFNYSCKKEETPLKDINLKVEKVNGLYKCTWNSTNISSFKSYTLIASQDSITIDLNLNIFFPSPKIIEDQTVDTWNFTIPSPFQKKYFQLRVDIGDRILYSDVVVFENPHTRIFNIWYADFIFHYPEIKTIYFRKTNKLIAYNYENNEFKEIEFEPYIERGVGGNNGFGDEIYLVTFDKRLIILDAHNLSFKDWLLSDNLTVHSVTTNQNGLIFLAKKDYNQPTQIYDRNGMTLLTTFDYANSSDKRGVGILSLENNQFLETGNTSHHIYDLDENGDIINHSSIINPFDDVPSQTHHYQVISSKGKYFVSSYLGDIFDSDLNPIGQLKTVTGNYYNSYLFDEDESVLYASTSINNTFTIQKFSLPDLTILESYESESFGPKHLFKIENQILILAVHAATNNNKVIMYLEDF